MTVRVSEISADRTHALRRRVLRDDADGAIVEWDGDDDPTTAHLGVIVGGEVVAVSTWLVVPDPLAPDRDAIQLRGMATDPSLVRRGLGRAMLDAGIQQAMAHGRDRVWANSRVAALGFYEAAGWTVTGPVFETAIAVPHRHVHIDLA